MCINRLFLTGKPFSLAHLGLVETGAGIDSVLADSTVNTMETSSYSTGREQALREGAITVYGTPNGQLQGNDGFLDTEAFSTLPSLYHAVMAKAPGDFACLMISSSLREAAAASRYPNHRAHVQTVGNKAYHPQMFPNFGLSPTLHTNDTLQTAELLAQLRRSPVQAVRNGVRQQGGRLLLHADALSQLPLTVEKSGRGNESATAQQTTFLSATDDPFLEHQHIGSLHEIPRERLGGPFPLIYLSEHARLRDLIGLPRSVADGDARRRECAQKIVTSLPEGGMMLALGGIDVRIRRAIAECLAEEDVYVTSPGTDVVVRGGSEFAKDLRTNMAGRGRPSPGFDVRQIFLQQRKK